jgi:hypothetical protein
MDARRFVGRAAVILLLAASGAARELEPEVEDQPPAKNPPRENPLARSAPKQLVRTPYVSVQVNVDAAGLNIVGDAANEPSIAVNPLNPNNMVIGWRQFDSITSNFRQAGWAYTFDKGQHWTFPGVLTPGTFRSDPVLDADADGVFYYQSLKGNFLMDTFKSVNGGVSWSAPVATFGGDKNWMVVDRSGGPGDGNVYGIWQRFAACCGTNVLTRSVNGGTSFESPVPVSRWPTFGTLAVGPDGTLFAAGIDGTTNQNLDVFVVARSENAQNTGVTPTFTGQTVDLAGRMELGAGPNPAGLLGQGNIAVDRSGTSERGNVYVVASVAPFFGFDPMEVYFARSTDGGNSWSAPVRVNDDEIGLNWQWLAAHAVAPNGRIDVVWFDTRDSGFENISRMYYSYSYDAGVTWAKNVPVTPSFDAWVGWPQQNKIGDYTTLVSDATGADVAYAATFNGEQDVYYLRLFPDCNNNFLSDVVDVTTGPSLDCDLNLVPDECQQAPACVGAGSVPGIGVPLTVERGASDAVVLAWGASCATADSDYAVYEGALGSFTTHARRTCTTAGARTWTLSPLAGDRYFLVVPVHADREGSYGTSGAGVERPQAGDACVPQAFATCSTAGFRPGSAGTDR